MEQEKRGQGEVVRGKILDKESCSREREIMFDTSDNNFEMRLALYTFGTPERIEANTGIPCEVVREYVESGEVVRDSINAILEDAIAAAPELIGEGAEDTPIIRGCRKILKRVDSMSNRELIELFKAVDFGKL